MKNRSEIIGNTARATGSKPNHAPGASGGGFTSSHNDSAACKPPATGSSHGRVRSLGQANATPAVSNGMAMRNISLMQNDEGQMTNDERSPKSDTRNRPSTPLHSDFGLRIYSGFRLSALGFSFRS